MFGFKGDVSNAISFIDETTVLYPAGSNTILYNTETKQQRFIPVTDTCEAITALCVSPNKRFVAVAERGDKSPLVAVYDLNTMRRRKILNPVETESKAIYKTIYLFFKKREESKHFYFVY